MTFDIHHVRVCPIELYYIKLVVVLCQYHVHCYSLVSDQLQKRIRKFHTLHNPFGGFILFSLMDAHVLGDRESIIPSFLLHGVALHITMIIIQYFLKLMKL